MQQVLEFIGNHPILVGLFFALLVALIITERRKGGESVTAQVLVRLVNKDDAIVIDLRDKNEFAAGHIAGAVNLPMPVMQIVVKSSMYTRTDRWYWCVKSVSTPALSGVNC